MTLTDKQIADSVRAVRPKAKARKYDGGIWAVTDGKQELSCTFIGRRTAWAMAHGKLIVLGEIPEAGVLK